MDNTHTPEPRKAKSPSMPLMLVDTNALINLSDLDRKLPLAGGRSIFGILDTLTQQGTATLMFPRSVFNESTNWDEPIPPKERLKGYLDFTRSSDGTLGICLSTERLNHEDNRHFTRWLQGKQAKGQLRLYSSLEECFNAGEPRNAQGGIAILDTGLLGPRPIYAVGAICDKIRNYDAPNAPAERLQPEAESGFGKGDLEFGMMGRCLSAYAEQTGTSPRCLFITDDKECKTNFLARASAYAPTTPPIHADLPHLLAAFADRGLLSREEYTAALDIAQHDIPKGNRPSPARLLRAPETVAITGWLADRGIATPGLER